jgi:hypothetical protein
VLSHQEGCRSAVALLLKAALIQVSDYRLMEASGSVIVYTPRVIQLNLSVIVYTPRGIQLDLSVIFNTPRVIQLHLFVIFYTHREIHSIGICLLLSMYPG